MNQYQVKEIHLDDHGELESITPLRDQKIPTVMTIAGSDSSGGAGIEADIKTITTHKCYALTNIVILTAQNTKGVCDVTNIPGKMTSSILEENFSDIYIDSIKTGILTEESIPEIKNSLDKYHFHGNLVVDPVMVSTSGYDFVNNKILEILTRYLAPYTTVITPNLIEAKAIINTLSGKVQYNGNCLEALEDVFSICNQIHKLTKIKNVLVKGGHQRWKNDAKLLTDVLYISEKNTYYVFYSEMLDSSSTHGTGCTLASAIASNLAHGLSLINAVGNSITYVQNGIKTAPNIGSGHGPLNHLQSVRQYNYEVLVNDEKYALPFKEGQAVQYMCNHPEISPFWEKYTHHPFMKKVGDYSLPLENFTKFVEQNVIYLSNYSHIIMYMAAKGSWKEDLCAVADKLTTMAQEISKYTTILKKLGYSDKLIEKLKATKECQVYVDALLDVAKDAGDVFDIAVSLTPCFYGYLAACANVKHYPKVGDICSDDTKIELYEDWLKQNQSEWYSSAWIKGEADLNTKFRVNCLSDAKLTRAVQLFKKFIIMEINFLDSFL